VADRGDMDAGVAGLGVPAAIAECYAAGVRVIMITGDYPGTARSIGRQSDRHGDRTGRKRFRRPSMMQLS
ncbi:MAG: hypothetical protein ABSA76_11135, partial [Bacteroidales bacterium]